MTEPLRIEQTPIPGLLVLHLPLPGDNRGWFKENWQREKMVAAGLPDFAPIQNNISYNAEPGVTRGIHAEPWDKYISVASGRVFGAWVDLREGENFGTVFTHEIGPDTAIFVPRGVGNGFQSLEPNTAYTYLVNAHWSPEAVAGYAFVNLADPRLRIKWPLGVDPAKLSNADLNHPVLSATAGVKPAKVAVVGANGQLGRAVVQALGDRAIAITRAELDLNDPTAIAAFDWSTCGAIVNASGYTQVDAAETRAGRSECWSLNAVAVASLARVATHHNVPLIHISTDYVYDGNAEVLTELSPVAPLSVYGCTKAAGELAVQQVPVHSIIRTSWLVGDGANFVRTMMGLCQRGIQPKVVADQFGRLTFATDLADFIVHLLQNPALHGTYNFSNSGAVTSWFDIAQAVWRTLGAAESDVTAVSTEEYAAGKDLAPRPRHSSFDLSKVHATGFDVRDHLERLTEYIGEVSEQQREFSR